MGPEFASLEPFRAQGLENSGLDALRFRARVEEYALSLFFDLDLQVQDRDLANRFVEL